eukprot:CAMPEP_0170072938 /NCGR_PEP_ID=MMETSP0019_2-20121128/10460_1 /TAXON_ID=98059 /ORGANISM="Dinobryon sp., Strain UTEXLB2267" /LENGTH=483 /DNA_ID=CAMNT_0010282177 /DNA_START=226 /DNA_END=1677 /DNA_ORIENTATION=+
MWSPAITRSLKAYYASESSNDDEVDAIQIAQSPSEFGESAALQWLSKNIRYQHKFFGELKPQKQSFVQLTPDRFDINGTLVDILGVVCESDTGLRVSEQYSFDLDLSTSNGVNEGRRDKYMMQEQLKQYFLSTSTSKPSPSRPPYIRQVLTDQWSEAKAFLLSLEESGEFPNACVIKPSRGAASVGVSKATNIEDAEKQFNLLLGTPGYANGTVSDAVLVQEWIGGVEYAVDTVSRNGEHKVVAIWRYDKRAMNGGPFVYFCTELDGLRNCTGSESERLHNEEISTVAEYAVEVLRALCVQWGPAHIEIMLASDPGRGPVLIEANVGRFHGQEVVQLSERCYGYSAPSVCCDAYLSQIDATESVDSDSDGVSERSEAWRRWKGIPHIPRVLGTAGARIVHLVSYVEGALSEPPRHRFNILTELPSLCKWSLNCEGAVEGEQVQRTVDLDTTLGYALLQHERKEQVDLDYAKLIAFQEDMLVVK